VFPLCHHHCTSVRRRHRDCIQLCVITQRIVD
jgi:hypothetical protein